MEYVGNRDLESMLLSEEREQREIREWSCRLKVSLEIAKGMDFCTVSTFNYTQRLETANVLVDCNYFCKVSIHLWVSIMNSYSLHSRMG